MKTKQQIPTPPNEWLYKEYDENTRDFFRGIILPEDADFLPECTQSEREIWESEHQPEEMEEI